ncbi:long-chain fatty acid--CoA ligase [Candidatus Aminicenantes bacterium AC-335-K20]|jgi:long-chain acyl-CoA synthetase|nr:long-chain fatty acid--CoA ligase [SCandidatus Aminicenantes bacterium Aminicenantia_JdfR_composite]MCP2597680.1 long-chain fatty acid--CoA ligase [Candidatus Aminicenantes bacterium AC-335-G13]MCP2597768.1 long-chain fatty acid--CoA ligase [Candidatus Aminicenantes bacterium AC-335-L06]MCP2605748.1 long-chain fatty acid--CoA ligase [Candidatus Aminicenantes bacterium AC-335-O07]MCP2619546.1 long-chain fatty acid--CoA ligase [Candidatus Aminicenantes bacterium AC-335-K20]MCP2620493.1 long-c
MLETLNQVFLNTVKNYPKENFVLYKDKGEYRGISTEEFKNMVEEFSLGLRELGVGKNDKIILLSENRPEWIISDLAILAFGGITVPIYPTLTAEQIVFIIDDSDAKVVIFSDEIQGEKIKSIKNKLSKVKHFISFISPPFEGALSFSQIRELGRKRKDKDPDLFEKSALEVKPDDLATIIYTSGTTGIPKGVMLTHKNILSNIISVSQIIEFSEKDTVLSFLPLSHILERMVTHTYIYKGCTIAYAESIETVAQNLLEVRPNIMVSVPRVFEKIYAKVMDNVLSSSPLKRKIFFWALNIGRKVGEKKLAKKPIGFFLKLKYKIAHKLVFSKIIEKTGGRIRFFVSGGAPLSKEIAEFFYAMGLVILEGYGLTETSPVISVNTFENLKFGTVGKPIPGVEVKIAEDGEILVRGPNVMVGYYKKEAETKEAFRDGWFHTGDIGYLDEDGFLVITDRKKDIIVTSGGKNVAPQPIENMLKANPYISNAVVVGDKRKFISALIIPDFDKLEEYARFNKIKYTDRKDLISKKEIKNFIKAEVDRATQGLAPYEQIKKIALLDREFEISKNEITPTLKVKRNIIEEKYKDLIDELYKEENEG